ncbi:TetR family transcriptional regulator [Planobispora rosea]|uniref:TetR family transcriptional regulator n=1 Tax=Planobispora rosea TaxID=35762 RepID=A0A8J3WFJ0_PLARO|nr:TetR family transcriptional regulator [Planobispora rosea]GIH85966.1 TetR family transcriptional regulator [Planobispora rosea]
MDHRKSPARTRVLDTAARLFYAEGVHSVGIDRIIAEAGVAKATFYHHFPSKDELVRAYLAEQSQAQRTAAAGLPTREPREAVTALFEFMCRVGVSPGYRGCSFLNAAAEYPDPAHPVRRVIDEHRAWLRGLFRDLLADDGHPDPRRTADILVLLRDGIVVGFDLDDPAAVRAAAREAVTRALAVPS